MEKAELEASLHDYGITMSPGAIRRLASDGIIGPQFRYKKEAGKGRGGPTDWSLQALGEIVAYKKLLEDPVSPAKAITVRHLREVWETLQEDAFRLINVYKRSNGQIRMMARFPLVHGPRRFGKGVFVFECDAQLATWFAIVQKVKLGLPLDERRIFTLIYWASFEDKPVEVLYQVKHRAAKDSPQDRVRLEFDFNKARIEEYP